jgi:hypothetical protein
MVPSCFASHFTVESYFEKIGQPAAANVGGRARRGHRPSANFRPAPPRPQHEGRDGLEYGERSDHPGFASDSERRAAWLQHRNKFLAKERPGRRPDAWWDYEAPFRRPDVYEREPARLYEAGLLGEEEKVELIAFWRHEFHSAQQPDFFICCGPGDFRHGAAARRAAYEDAGIPRELVRQWTAAHQRRAKTIRKLQTTRKDEPAKLDGETG